MVLPVLALITGVLSVTASGDFAVSLDFEGGGITVTDSAGDSLYSVEAQPGERLSYVVFRDMKLVYLSSSRGLLETDILTGETTVVSSRRTGAPWISSDGALWYTLNGSLYCDGAAVNGSLPAFYVSVENGTAVYTDRNDVLRILNIDTGRERMVQGYRFYAPIVLESGDVIAPTLSGALVYLPADGSLMVVGSGEQPCWSGELGGLFFCVSTDDGHELTGSDLWFVRPGENPIQLTFTPDVFEIKPSCSGNLLWYIDDVSGAVCSMSLDGFSL